MVCMKRVIAACAMTPVAVSAFEVDALLADKLAADGVTDGMLVLKRANLSALHLGPGMSRAERRAAVAQYLRKTAAESQVRALSILREHEIESTSFWISNAIHVSNLTSSALAALQQQESVQLFRAVGGFRKPTPIQANIEVTEEQSESTVAWNIAKVRADEAWSTADGSGVVLATLDGGVRYDHEALVDNYRGNNGDGTFSHDYNWKDWAYKAKHPEDSDGHGTNVQGIATGSRQSGVGVAPGAKWISAKMCNFAGYCDEKWTISAAQWAMCPEPVASTDSDCSLGADVLSCSWGEDDAEEPYLMDAVNAWLKAGMVPVFAVGNSGPQCKTSVSPADYAGVVGVGATYESDQITSYSSRGPAAEGGSELLPYDPLTPSIVAPGQGIKGPDYDGEGYTKFSGTSQACPHVAGAAAILLSKFPKLTPEQVKSALHEGASQAVKQPGDGASACGGLDWNTFPNYIYGYGRLDIVAALEAAGKGPHPSPTPAPSPAPTPPSPTPPSKPHYGAPPCINSDESAADLDTTASVCAAYCDTSSDCPTDVSSDVKASPHCEEGVCYLQCRNDSGCPDGAKCIKDGLLLVYGQCGYPKAELDAIWA